MSPAVHPDSSPGSQRAESMASRRIAIVGGGPSGALCAERLASAGFQVDLFDEHLAWEKPCGGGLTHKAVLNYPFLLNGPHPKKMIHQVQLISGNGDRAHLCCDHPSVGICGSLARHTSRELHQHLAQFMREERISTEDARFYSHVLPSPRAHTLASRRIAGRNWALIGDAAGWVDPITGEGLYYALRSGELLAESLVSGQPERYPRRVRDDFSADLEVAARIARNFYHGNFLGGAVTTRMIQFIARSTTFRTMIADLFSGAQNYSTLKRRLWTQLAATLAEVLDSVFRTAKSTTPSPSPGDA